VTETFVGENLKISCVHLARLFSFTKLIGHHPCV
jgi:hypothetical protein